MNKLFLIDAYALIYRSYYAFMGRRMSNADGLNTAAIFGFTKFLRDLIKREKPKYLGVAFDPSGGTFRHVMYPLYKANRSETPEDIKISVPYIKEILNAMCIPILEVQGYEADDVIGTLSAKAAKEGYEVYMVTPDKDYGQLVQDNVYMYKQRKEGIEIIGREQIKEHYGIDEPLLIIDILALWGDASDNIPGVVGVGEKGAIKLVNQFGTVENILENVDKLKGKQKENVIAAKNQLSISKVLTTIDLNVPIEFEPESLRMINCDETALKEIYKELGFFSFIREMEGDTTSPFGNGYHTEGAKTAAPIIKEPTLFDVQGSLFGADMSPILEIPKIKPTPIPAPIAVEVAEQTASEDEVYYDSVTTLLHNYMTINSDDELKELVGKLMECDEFCFDTETTGLDAFNDTVIGISFCSEVHSAYYLPLNNSNIASSITILQPLFECETIAKIGQNIKFDIMMLRSMGLEVKGVLYDTMLLHYLLSPESRHNMNYLSRNYLQYMPIEIESLIGKGVKQVTMDMIPVEQVAEYAAEDADVTFRLKSILWAKIKEEGFAELYLSVEEPLIKTLVDVEMAGAKIDTAGLAHLGERLNIELIELESKIKELAEEPELNVNSPKQLGEVLFGKLAIDKKPKVTKTKQYRTDEEYLQTFVDKHPIIAYVLEYRGIKKLLSTYIEALPALINPKTGRIHTSFNQAVAVTGRLSSSKPNLQNIPIRDILGKEIRKCFIASDTEHSLLSVDYSQVELRLMAHLSGDEALLEAFNNGEDIHSATAARIYNIPIEDVTSDQRRKAKTANFGIIYGISAFGLAQRLNIPRSEAKELIEGYFNSYGGVKNYMDNVIVEARDKGYVTTIFGRKRFLADITSANAVVRSIAERNAINAPIQGSAADIMKLAMITVGRELQSRGLQSKVILQVHDELLIDVLNSEKDEVTKMVRESMESVAKLSVELLTEYGIAPNWLDAH